MVIDNGSTMRVQSATKLGPALGEISILHCHIEWGHLYDNCTIEQSCGHVDRCEDPLSSRERLDGGVPHTFRGLNSSQSVEMCGSFPSAKFIDASRLLLERII
jgi:hypothetical protein